MEFKTEETEANIGSLIFNPERHGDEKKICAILNIKIEVPPDVLDQISKNTGNSFSKALYDKDGNFKTHGIDEMKFNTRFDHHVVKLNYSIDDDHAKEFTEAKILKFKADPQNGYIVDLYLQLQLHLSKENNHWLLDGREIDIWTFQSLGAQQGGLNLVDNGSGDGSEEDEPAAA